jgi:hypothetical protein
VGGAAGRRTNQTGVIAAAVVLDPCAIRGEAAGSQRSLEVTSVASRRSTRHSS